MKTVRPPQDARDHRQYAMSGQTNAPGRCRGGQNSAPAAIYQPRKPGSGACTGAAANFAGCGVMVLRPGPAAVWPQRVTGAVFESDTSSSHF